MARLEEICSLITDGSHFSPEDEGVGYPMFSVKDMTPNGFNISGCKKIGEEAYKKLVANGCKPLNDDVVVAKDGSYLKTAFVIKGNPEIALLSSIAILRPKIDLVVPEYLSYFLKSDAVYRTVSLNYITGTALKRIILKGIRKIEVDLPDIGEQEQRAQRLSKVDYLCQLRKQQLDKLDELVKARFVEMFGDPVKNTMDWEIKSLSELGELNRGVSKARPRNSPELLGGPYPLIQTGEVANAKTYITSFNSTYSEKGLAQSKMWPKGTLCITIAANIAQTSILTFDACFPDSVVGFISRNMTNELFIHYWFSFFQKILDEQAPQVAQKNINLKILSELNVIVPPLSLQNRFAAFVKRVDQQKQTVQQSLEKLELMKKALMQEYFG